METLVINGEASQEVVNDRASFSHTQKYDFYIVVSLLQRRRTSRMKGHFCKTSSNREKSGA